MSASIYRLLRMAGYELLATDPVTELFTGRIYFNTILESLRVFDGTIWINAVSTSASTLTEFNIAVGDNTNAPVEVDTSTLGDISADTVNGLKIKKGAAGFGLAPLGSIIAYHGSIVAGTLGNPSSGVVYNGWQLCDGTAIAASQVLSGTLPQLTDGRYLRGFSSAGSFSGSNTKNPSAAFNAAGSYAPSGSVTGGTYSFNTDSLDSGTYQTAHTHNLGGHSHALPHVVSNAFVVQGVTSGGVNKSVNSNSAPSNNYGPVTDSDSGLTGSGSAFFNNATYGVSKTANSSFSGSSAARSDWFLNSNVNIEPQYMTTYYMMRVS